MRHTHTAAGLLALCLLAPACTPASMAHSRPTPARSARTLTMVEVRRPGIETAFQAIQQFRPTWLNRATWITPGVMTGDVDPYPTVYIGNIWCGGIECLDGIEANCVKEIRYYSPTDATIRWGRGHTSGVISVTLTARG